MTGGLLQAPGALRYWDGKDVNLYPFPFLSAMDGLLPRQTAEREVLHLPQ